MRAFYRVITLIVTLLALFRTGWAVAGADYPCPAAPAPRLHVGTAEAPFAAVVAPGLGPLNLRSLPAVSTGIENQLYGGNRVVVVGGPSCNGGLRWWRVENVNGTRGWVAEGSWSGYYLLPAAEYDALVANTALRAVTPYEATCARRPRACPAAE